MEITRNSIETGRGPAEWFTGAVYIDAVATPSGDSRLRANSLAHAPQRADDLRPRGRWPRAAPRRPGRGDPSGRPRVLRARRRALARVRPRPFHDPPRDARGRRPGPQRHL